MAPSSDRDQGRQSIEEALRATERRLSAAVEASGAGVFELEIPLERVVYASERLAEIVGFQRSDLEPSARIREWLERRLHPEDRARVRTAYRELSERRRDSFREDVRFRHRSGAWRWLRIWAKTTAAGQGPRGKRSLVGVAMDVTFEKERAIETERRSRQLRALAAELYHVEERERRALATELHDNLAQLVVATKLKLSSMTAYTDRDVVAGHLEEALEFLDRADECVRSLTFSLSPPVLEELGLASAVKSLTKDLERQFGLRVALEIRGEPVVVDPRIRFMFFRSIRELLINAAKHAQTAEARVLLDSPRPGAVRVVVEDEGRGFDVSRVQAETSRGFGLFSIRERIESIGGSMEVRSQPGRGTSVTLWLEEMRKLLDRPTREREQGGSGPHAAGVVSPRKTIRVLLADDHEIVRSALARLLENQADLQVIGEASDGKTVCELVELLTPDVVLMDVTMSGVSGIEATRRIAAEHPESRVIGLSMHESGEIASAMRRAGAFEYLWKSSPTHLLLETIRRAARHSRGEPGQSPGP